MTLRASTADDLEFLDRLHTGCMREHVERHHPWNPEQFRATFDPTRNHVILVDGVEVGLLSRWEEPGAIRIGNLLVASTHLRRGVGGRVLREVLEEARRRGIACCAAIRLGRSTRAMGSVWRRNHQQRSSCTPIHQSSLQRFAR